jgi:hypothetical protein
MKLFGGRLLHFQAQNLEHPCQVLKSAAELDVQLSISRGCCMQFLAGVVPSYVALGGSCGSSLQQSLCSDSDSEPSSPAVTATVTFWYVGTFELLLGYSFGLRCGTYLFYFNSNAVFARRQSPSDTT